MDAPDSPPPPLRHGWTTGACAAAAAKAAFAALRGDAFPDPVTITLPKGQTPSFPLALSERGADWARAGVVKDAGDDPDVTHGALIVATVRAGAPDAGVTFRAGEGVGTVTKPGLPVPPGEPAINPRPREIIAAALAEVAGGPCDADVEISIPGGERLAARTWNPRLGIVGGLSVLGTTGVVVPYSCSAWIHSIQSGIDVARATGLTHVAGCTGSTSEASVRRVYGLDDAAILDMGDFAGGLLKYLRRHPLPRLTVAGGFAKLAKLAAGHLDLHSKRSQVDMGRLAEWAGLPAIATANTAKEALEIARQAGVPLADAVAARARAVALDVLGDSGVSVDVLVVDRAGAVVGRAGPDE